jgi:hypothetical protein
VKLGLCAAVAVVVLSGCGQSATDKASKQFGASLNRLALDENFGEILTDVQRRPGMLDTHLHRYDLSARALAKAVGKEKVRRILADDATRIQPICGTCADAIDRTRETL